MFFYGMAAAVFLYLIYDVATTSNRKSLHINIPPASVERLEEVCRNAGIPDKVEVVRQAVSLYAKLMEYEVLGGETCVRLPDGNIITVRHGLMEESK